MRRCEVALKKAPTTPTRCRDLHTAVHPWQQLVSQVACIAFEESLWIDDYVSFSMKHNPVSCRPVLGYLSSQAAALIK